jgi:hypothetical protein
MPSRFCSRPMARRRAGGSPSPGSSGRRSMKPSKLRHRRVVRAATIKMMDDCRNCDDRAAEKCRPMSSSRSASMVGRARLDSSRRGCSPHTHIASAARHIAQFVEFCRASTRSNGDLNHCAVAASHDRGSGPITALPTGFWRPLPKISRSRPARESTTPKSARHGIPPTRHAAGDGSIRRAGR